MFFLSGGRDVLPDWGLALSEMDAEAIGPPLDREGSMFANALVVAQMVSISHPSI